MKAARSKVCRWCESLFEPLRPLQVVCSPPCAVNYGREKVAKARITEARKAKREYRKKSLSLSKLKNLAQREFNKFIRLRDAGQPCISCGRNTGAKMNAGHYRTTAAAGHLRYNEDNCHLQCEHCNSHKSGNLAEYRPKLVTKIGSARVEALENDNSVKHWTREELIAIRKEYLSRWKALEAAK